MEKVNKSKLAKIVSEKTNIEERQVEKVIDVLTDTITEILKNDGEVFITGFGSFSSKKRAGRIGVNPRNISEKIDIPSVKVAKFKAGKVLKETLKGKEAVKPSDNKLNNTKEEIKPEPIE